MKENLNVKSPKYIFHFSVNFVVQCDLKCCNQNVDGFPAGFLALGELQPYSKALETFLQQVASHSILCKNKAAEVFLTSSDVSGQK